MKRIVGIFHSEDQAVRAIEGLRSSGYRDDEISIITKNEEKYNALTNRVGTDINNDANDTSGAAAGAVTGGTIGGLGGLLLGLGALAIPGVGPIVAAGPIAAALTGALAGGAVGGLAGALIDYGVPETEAKEYEERINAGDILILVEDDDKRRDSVYENFRDNESINRDAYTYGERVPDDVSSPGLRGNTNNMVDSHQTARHSDPIDRDMDRDKPSPRHDGNRDRELKRDVYDHDSRDPSRPNIDKDKPSPAYDGGIATPDKGWNEDINDPDNKDPINRDVDRNRREDDPMDSDMNRRGRNVDNDPIDRDMDRDKRDVEADPLKRDRNDPAYDDMNTSKDKGWNEGINKPGGAGNTDHSVDSHDRYIEEEDPLRADKPFDLDPNLRDVDNSLT